MTRSRIGTLGTQLGALVELARVGNVLMAAVGAGIGALVAAGTLTRIEVGLAAVATALVTAGGNALNDVVDRRIDAQAHPHRPIPSGRLPIPGALGFGAVSFAVALGAGWLAGRDVFLVVLGAEALLLLYEVHLKALGFLGNVLVAALVAMTFVVGAMAVDRVTAPVGFLAGLSLLANVGREAWKDAEDAPHDVGRRTLAQRYGNDAALRLGTVLTLAAVALSPLPYLVGFGGWPYLALVGIADAVFLAAIASAKPARAQRLSKAAMVLALAAFGLGGTV